MLTSPLHLDRLPPARQSAMAALVRTLPYPWVRDRFARCCAESDPKMRYIQYMKLELLWFRRRFLRTYFLHEGVEHIDPRETYLLTSLHFGNFCMYGASLNQQFGIKSRSVVTGRNIPPGSHETRFWVTYFHAPQILTGYPVCYSTDSPFLHVERLRQGVSLNMLLDPRERGFQPREYMVDFLSRPLSLQRAVSVLARRTGVRILPYIGCYDRSIAKHRVIWFPPVAPGTSDRSTLQGLVRLFEDAVSACPAQYFYQW